MFNNSSLGSYSRRLRDYCSNEEFKRVAPSSSNFRVLRIICQRPFFTGSGINFTNLIRQSREAGLEQYIIFGLPVGEKNPLKDYINIKNTSIVSFKNGRDTSLPSDVPFPIVGMSDQMPYKSTRFSDFNEQMLEQYLKAFADKINEAVEVFQPSFIHSHHLWLITALSRVLNPHIPIIATCHNTALRQMISSPQLIQFVINPIKDLDKIAVLNEEQEHRIKHLYQFDLNLKRNDQFFCIGQGIDTALYNPKKRMYNRSKNKKIRIMYAGKLSNAKGVPQLIEAFKLACNEIEDECDLFIAGSGKGKERDKIEYMARDNDNIHFLGQLKPEQLSRWLRSSDLFILPSFYDELPKVLLEALACGCRAIMTDQSGIKDTLLNSCGVNEILQFISLPEMESIDLPKEEALPGFINELKEKIKNQILLVKNEDESAIANFSMKIINAFGKDALFKKYLTGYEEL